MTKISNQVAAVSSIIKKGNYEFKHQEFRDTLSQTGEEDMVYCDPPYIGRHVDYFDSWSEKEETDLHTLLVNSNAPFIMSTWLKNRYRVNDFVFSLWGDCSILVKKHFYHVGAKEKNRNAVFEALLINFHLSNAKSIKDIDVGSADLRYPSSKDGGLERLTCDLALEEMF